MAVSSQLHQAWSFETQRGDKICALSSSSCQTRSAFHGFYGRRQGEVRKRCQMISAVNGKVNLPFFQEGRRGITHISHDSESIHEERNLSRWYNESDEEIEAEMNNNATIGNDGEDPYRILESGQKVYLDELDVITLLDPPAYLIPNDANTYDQAAYLWKKIGDIPKERRHRLLDLLTPKLVQTMWEIAGDYSRISNSDPGSILLGSQSESFMKTVTWDGRAFSDSWLLNQFSAFQKVFFLSTDGSVYGRVILGGWMVKYITTQLMPLYFEVRETRKVVATEEACNIALDYGDGQLHLLELPQNFPKPVQHLWPFNDASFCYLRPVGPGVLVGQWWIEGRDLEKIPEKYADFVLIKEYGSK